MFTSKPQLREIPSTLSRLDELENKMRLRTSWHHLLMARVLALEVAIQPKCPTCGQPKENK